MVDFSCVQFVDTLQMKNVNQWLIKRLRDKHTIMKQFVRELSIDVTQKYFYGLADWPIGQMANVHFFSFFYFTLRNKWT